ncbi:MAG: DHH family phosphoesterase [Bacteroidota bacterium]
MNQNLQDFSATFFEIQNANNIVITSHKSPDGDSLGSSLALYHFIKKFNSKVSVCHPDQAPYFYNWLPDLNEINLFQNNKEVVTRNIEKADLIFCLDYNSYERLGSEFGALIEESSVPKILIDHHQNPTIDALISISNTSIGSTSELIFELIYNSNSLSKLDEKIATYLYLGIMTDTGSFRYPSVSFRTHEILAELLKTGMNHSTIHERIFDSNTIDRLRLKSYAIVDKLELLSGYPIGIITVTNEELNRFNHQKGDTEGLVNMILSIEKIMVAAIFIEHEDGIKISFRSKGDFFVNELAHKYFEGGGHKYAAGGFSSEKLDLVVSKFKKLISGGFYA